MSVPADHTNTGSDEQNDVDKVAEEPPVVKKPVYDDILRLAVFDDGNQVHCIRTPFFSVSDGFVTYKEPDDADKIPKDKQIELREILPIIMYKRPEAANKLRWIRCHEDLRKELIYLDLEDRDYTFGSVSLGKGKRKTGDNLTQTDEDGVTVRYSLSYDKSYGIAGESCFRLHEITLPLSRLKKGISNSNF